MSKQQRKGAGKTICPGCGTRVQARTDGTPVRHRIKGGAFCHRGNATIARANAE